MRDDSLGPEQATPQAWLDWTSRRQSLASDPARSAWVSANAGSGKTHVLTQRVIRLLLAGCRPSAILCLTYTKAAASEMSNRVFERLAECPLEHACMTLITPEYVLEQVKTAMQEIVDTDTLVSA